jgi:alkylation response protein AidB-like acyl-CoA dehydrogenase
MDFELSEDQVALQDGIRSLLEGRFDSDTVRAMADQPGAVDRGAWAELAETGVFSLTLPEADGGVGMGLADAVLVFEQLGRVAFPGPLVGSFLAAGHIEGAADGSVVVGTTEAGESPQIIDHLGGLDQLVLWSDDSLVVVDATDLGGHELDQPLDFLNPVWRVDTELTGTPLGDAATAADWRLRGTILTAAQQVGLAVGAMELGLAYAKEREQFGKPIGAFQAVKHMCAEMLAHAEVAKAAVYAAGVHYDQPDTGDVVRAASAAKLVADEAAAFCAKTSVQVHGGMGYTWEVDAHLFLKRAWVLATTFGDTDDHAETVAALL